MARPIPRVPPVTIAILPDNVCSIYRFYKPGSRDGLTLVWEAARLVAGLAPGYVGLYQVNAKVPAGLPAYNATPVVISMPGATSNTVTIAVE